MGRVLSSADEARLSLAIERGDERAREEMITANLRLVCLLARRYRGLRVPFEDLVQEGTVGLVRAVDRFDHRCGAKFSTFAVWWIRRAMTDAVQGERTIRIPPRAARALAAVERAEQELRRQLPGPPSTEAIAARTGLTVRAVGRCARRLASRRPSTRCTRRAPRWSTSSPTRIPRTHGVGSTSGRLAARSGRCSGVMPPRHREVLVRRFGIGGDAQTHAVIGAALGVSEERSRQLERRALHWLRELGGGRRDAA